MKIKDPVMGETWVLLAAMLAFTEEQCGRDKLAAIKLVDKLTKPRARKKLDAFMRDPANRAKIFSRKDEAAAMLGLTGGTRH